MKNTFLFLILLLSFHFSLAQKATQISPEYVRVSRYANAAAINAAIPTPASGMLVYNESIKSFMFHDGVNWVSVANSTSLWSASGSNIVNSNSGNVYVGTENTNNTYRFSVSDSLSRIAVGPAGAEFNNIHSGEIIFGEDLNYIDYCGINLYYNGQANDLYLIGACSTTPDTIARFNREGASNINRLRIGSNYKKNPFYQFNVDGISGFNGNVTIDGNLQVTGSISKGSGTFKIDHPLDPANRYLVHSFVESPDMMNVYTGNISTDQAGFATVELPTYFEAANKDFRYSLTVIGTFAQAIVKEKISNNRFVIQTSEPGVEVSWSVTGIRADKFADAHRVIPEQEKEFKNSYIHPDLYGASSSRSVTSLNQEEAAKALTDYHPEDADMK